MLKRIRMTRWLQRVFYREGSSNHGFRLIARLNFLSPAHISRPNFCPVRPPSELPSRRVTFNGETIIALISHYSENPSGSRKRSRSYHLRVHFICMNANSGSVSREHTKRREEKKQYSCLLPISMIDNVWQRSSDHVPNPGQLSPTRMKTRNKNDDPRKNTYPHTLISLPTVTKSEIVAPVSWRKCALMD